MCTLTWINGTDGVRVFFNRDEKRTRLPAQPPVTHRIEGVRVLAPVDGDGGGTWLAVNEHRLAVCVLNFYEADAALPPGGRTFRSRGLMVLHLSAARSLDELRQRVADLDPENFRPFILAGFDGGGARARFRWNGRMLSSDDLPDTCLPVTTSSFRTAGVLAARKRMFDALAARHGGVSADMLRAFQHSRDEEGGAYSVTMTRPDAQTVSYSEVLIDAGAPSFVYQPRRAGLDDPAYADPVRYRLEDA